MGVIARIVDFLGTGGILPFLSDAKNWSRQGDNILVFRLRINSREKKIFWLNLRHVFPFPGQEMVQVVAAAVVGVVVATAAVATTFDVVAAAVTTTISLVVVVVVAATTSTTVAFLVAAAASAVAVEIISNSVCL